MTKNRLIQRLAWYYPAELGGLRFFVGLLLYQVWRLGVANGLFLLYGLLVVIFVLYQGQRYWKLKLWRLQGREFDEAHHLRFFTVAKQANKVLILLMPVVLVGQWIWAGGNFGPNNTLLWALLANTFGILEHVNYYHRQLSIDNAYDIAYLRRNRRLKIASLAKDLREGKL